MVKKKPDTVKQYQMIDNLKDDNDVTYVRLPDVILWLKMSADLDPTSDGKRALTDATRLLGGLL
jgi:hypothetical protein